MTGQNSPETPRIRVSSAVEELRLRAPFRISDREFVSVGSLLVTASERAFAGRGEAQGVYWLDDTPGTMQAELNRFIGDGEVHFDRHALQSQLPPGGVRNALDCALWDLECKKSGQRIWTRLGLAARPLPTAITIGFDPLTEKMVQCARELNQWPMLKVKLSADDPVGRMRAIRKARPNAELMVDANQGWSFEELVKIAPALARLGVTLIEQPLPRGEDDPLGEYACAIPLCADESCLHYDEIEIAARRYQMINIKLDKCGGLTEAFRMAFEIRRRGLRVMVGNMGGSSLAMAPGFVIGLMADKVDLDGPLDLLSDRSHPLRYRGGMIDPPSPMLWG